MIKSKQESINYKAFLEIKAENLQPISYTIASIENLEIFRTNPKLLARLRLNIENLSIYEAHQLFKTINFRLVLNYIFYFFYY